MDRIDEEKTSSVLPNVQNQLVESVLETSTPTPKNSEIAPTENICEELQEKNAIPVKNTVEILKVELIASQKEKENLSVLCSDDEEKEKSNRNQTGNNATLESNEVKIIDVNVEEKESLTSNSEGPTTIISENLDVAISSGLSLLAQYHSDDDTESVIEVPITNDQNYRNNLIEIDSDSDSDTSSHSSDVEDLNNLRKTIEKHIDIDDCDEDLDDNEDNAGKKKPHSKLRVKGELLLEDLPPIQDLQITVPADECIEFGKIHLIVDQLVLVNALPNSILLNLETVMFLDKGQKVLGEVFDVLGQVADPLYCVRFNSNKEIIEKQINIGNTVYIAPKTQYTQYVILSNLIKLKGSDASWENDVEPPPRYLEYSDDEQEQFAKKQLRNKDRPIDNEDVTKRVKAIDEDSTKNRSHTRHRNSQTEQRNGRGVPPGHSNNVRSRYGEPHQNHQRMPNQYRSSWHSNYYPQAFPYARDTYGMHSAQNLAQPSQAYRPYMPVHAMPNVHNMTYPRSQSTQYIAPPGIHPMPNVFNVRPPIIHGPSHTSHHQYTSPPPPGSGSE